MQVSGMHEDKSPVADAQYRTSGWIVGGKDF